MVGLLPASPNFATMSITKKHFIAIARAIRRSGLSTMQSAEIADTLSKELKVFNSNFDPERFFEAATGFTLRAYQEWVDMARNEGTPTWLPKTSTTTPSPRKP